MRGSADGCAPETVVLTHVVAILNYTTELQRQIGELRS
jgi:hypothetical protein